MYFLLNIINFPHVLFICIILSFIDKPICAGNRTYYIISLQRECIINLFYNNFIFCNIAMSFRINRNCLSLSTTNLSTSASNLSSLLEIVCSLAISNLSTSNFKLIKSTSLAYDDVSTPVTFLCLILLCNLKDLIQLLHFQQNYFNT